MRTKPRFTTTALVPLMAAIAFGLYLANTWAVPLSDPDEGRYAEIGREMLASGDWLVPQLFGLPYVEKPPLTHWLTALALWLFGLNEFAARLMPALAAALGLLGTGLGVARLLRPRVGVFSVIMLATSLLYFAMARLLLTDMLFTTFLTLALWSYAMTVSEHWRARPGYAVFWVLLAGAMMTKGPVGPALAGIIITCDLAGRKSLRTLVSAEVWLSFPLFVLLTLPWFLAVEQRHAGFLNFYVIKEHLQRAGGGEHRQPFWYFGWVVAAGLMPWTFVAMASLPLSWKSARAQTVQGHTLRLLLIWPAVVLAFFSAMGGKLIPYILPMLPPLAVLAANYLDTRLETSAWPSRGMRMATMLTVVTLSVLAIGVFAAQKQFGIEREALPRFVVSLPLLVAAGATLRWLTRLELVRLGAMMASLTLFYLGLALILPSVTDTFALRGPVRRAQQQLQPGDDVVMINFYMPSVAFYTQQVPYVVGGRGELALGAQFAGRAERLVDKVADLPQRLNGRRAAVFLRSERTSAKYAAMNAELQTVKAYLRNEVGSLVSLSINQRAEVLLLSRKRD